MYRVLLLILLITCFRADLYAQKLKGQAYVDSVEAILPAMSNDTGKVLLLSKLSKEYSVVNQQKALETADEAYSLAEQLNWGKGKAAALISIGIAHRRRDMFPQALKCYTDALEIAQQNRLTSYTADALNNIGIVYIEMGDDEKSLEYYQQALDAYTQLNDLEGEARILNNMAAIYRNKKDYNTTLDYYKRSLEMNIRVNSTIPIALSYNNIGYTYMLMGEYDKATENFERSLKLNKEAGNKFRISENYSNMAEISLLAGNNQKAIFYTNEAIRYLDDIGNLAKLGDYYRTLAKAHKRSGHNAAALKAYEHFMLLMDSLQERRNEEQVARLELRSEFEKKQLADSIANAQAERLAAEKLLRQKAISYSGITIAIALILLSVIAIRERRKSDSLLLNILPSQVTKELKKRGATTTHHFDHVTVIFTDFVAFTKAGERMGSNALVEELHNCFKAFDGIVSKYGIEKIKTIGDAYLAVCGLPSADNHHAEKVVKAALEIRTFMVERRKQLGDKTFEVRIGIHSGEVVAGIVGVKKFAYDIWGDTVNTAARMEQNSVPGKINISQTTYDLVKDKFTCTYRGEHDAKNKGKLKMYFVEA